MPEGDTIWWAARNLDAALAGHELTSTDFRVPALATVDLAGHVVEQVVPRGKHLLMRLDGNVTIHSHLRMDGSWHLYRPPDHWRGGPEHEVRVVLRTADRVAVGYRLPVLDLVPTDAEDTDVGHLGPDLLGSDWDLELALSNLRAQPEREIGDALLDQRNLSGIGNLYKCEALFAAGVDPFRPVGDIDDLAAVVVAAHRLLTRSIRAAVASGVLDQATTGDRRRPHAVFERAGRPCPRCGTAIRQGRQGQPGRDRVTYWCPRCQR